MGRDRAPGGGVPTGHRGRAGPGAVLVLVEDPDLRAALLAACREGAVAPEVHDGPPDPATWAAAALVLMDAAAASAVGAVPRRAGVVLVHPGGPGTSDGGGPDPGPEVWRLAVAAGAEHVVRLPEGAGWLSDLLVRAVRPRGRCVAVVGARGGAGATSAAVALATAAAAAGRRVVLVDLDPLGAGVDLAMGAEELPGLRWPDLHDVRSPLPPGGLSAALPQADGVAVLAWGRGPSPQAAAVRAVVRAALDEHDLVLLDLPRSGEPAAASSVTASASAAAAAAADVVVCVCPRELRAVAAAPAVLRRWGPAAELHLLVRGPAPGGLRGPDAAAAVRAGLDLLPGGAAGAALQRVDVVAGEPGLAGALERGEAFAVAARSPLRRWARRWLAEELPEVRARAA